MLCQSPLPHIARPTPVHETQPPSLTNPLHSRVITSDAIHLHLSPRNAALHTATGPPLTQPTHRPAAQFLRPPLSSPLLIRNQPSSMSPQARLTKRPSQRQMARTSNHGLPLPNSPSPSSIQTCRPMKANKTTPLRRIEKLPAYPATYPTGKSPAASTAQIAQKRHSTRSSERHFVPTIPSCFDLAMLSKPLDSSGSRSLWASGASNV